MSDLLLLPPHTQLEKFSQPSSEHFVSGWKEGTDVTVSKPMIKSLKKYSFL